MANCKECIHWEACKGMYEAMGNSIPEDFIGGAERCDTFVPTADVVPRSEVEDAKIKAVATVILEISKMLKSSYNRKHAFVNDEFLRGRDGAYQEFIDILTEISRKNAEGDK